MTNYTQALSAKVLEQKHEIEQLHIKIANLQKELHEFKIHRNLNLQTMQQLMKDENPLKSHPSID
jgi:predicted RNase H-like nuclease (RuvC/YqgF family)